MEKKFHRLISGFLATVFVLSLLLSGTLGWMNLTQEALNEAQMDTNKSNVELIKQEKLPDGTLTTTPIAGAKFHLFKADGTQINGVYITDEAGKIKVDLPAGDYYFEEFYPSDGFTYDKDENQKPKTKYPFTVKDNEAQVVVVKAYNVKITGPLIIKKTVINDDKTNVTDEQLKELFEFTVTFSDNGEYTYYIIDRNGKESAPQKLKSGDKIYLKHGEQAVFKDIPVGVQYVVHETSKPGYQVQSNGSSGHISDKDSVADFINKYKPEYGDLEITKEVKGNGADLNKEFEFIVTFSDNGEYTYTIDNGPVQKLKSGGTIKLKHGQKAVFKDIPVGVKYTVVEKDYSNDGYIPSIEKYDGVINGGQVIKLPFVNIYCNSYIPGKLTVEKEVLGDNPDPNKEFTFEVTFEGEGAPQSPQRFTIKAGQKFEIANIPQGVKYTVREINSAGYLPDTEIATGVIIGNQNTVVKFTNRVVPPQINPVGDLEITKEVKGEGADLNKEFEFTVTFSDNGEYDYTIDNGPVQKLKSGATIKLRHGQKAVFKGIPVGVNYTVVEKDYSNEGYVPNVKEYKGTIRGVEKVVAPFINVYQNTNKFGDLLIEKEVLGNNPDLNKDFTFEITFEGVGAPQSPQRFTLKGLKGQNQKRFTNIPAGVKYTVKEIDPAGYLPDITVASGVIVEGQEVIVKFKNKTPPPPTDILGGLIITKEVKGEGADLNKEFEFTVTFTPDGEYTYIIDNGKPQKFKNGDIIKLKHGQKVEFIDVPVGVNYTVVEKDYSNDGYIGNVTEYKGTIKGSEKVNLPFINVYGSSTTELGKLVVEKEVLGNNPDPNKEFTFEVTFEGEGAPQSPQRFKLKAGQKFEIANIPAGVKYTIKEIDPAGYLPDVDVATGVIIGAQDVSIKFTNRVPVKLGGLVVKKQLAGNYPPEELQREFNFTLIINGESQKFTLRPGESKYFDNLPLGAIYEIIEENTGTYIQSVVNGFGTINIGTTEAIFTNTYKDPDKVIINGQKHWDLTGYPEAIIPKSITVRLKHGDIIVEEKVVQANENGEWHYTFEAPKYDANGNEIHYTIEEVPIDGFIPIYDGYNITNTALTPVEIDAPIIEKKIVGENAPETEFVFAMIGKDGAPMPEGSTDNIKIVKLTGQGQIELGKIKFTQPGVYKYDINEVNSGNEGWKYDNTVYTLEVKVELIDGKLIATSNLTKVANVPEIVDKAVFTNIYGQSTEDGKFIISGQKIWNHGNNPIENRPKEIIVLVYADGDLIIQQQVTEKDNWQYSFELPEYAPDGHKIEYKIDEIPVIDYDTVVDGYNLINTHKSHTDGDNPNGNTPDNGDSNENTPNVGDGQNPDINTDGNNSGSNSGNGNSHDLPTTKDKISITILLIIMVISGVGLIVFIKMHKKK